ncbi:ABC transporter ATP-binding protein [Brevundimonas sp. FT23028]|uniref:ABC transporter ATP-binding protein n=1 Tax=Brevundimonas sp. FT23028 TaxID=3393748 RepID=UPI003B58AB6A
MTVADVGFRHRGAARDALSGVSFTVAQGSCFGLLGPNGAGKSTLFSLLTGILPLQGGEITVDGLSLRHDLKAVRDIGALAPQDLAFYPDLTARENLSFFAGACRLSKAGWREQSAAAIETCRLQDLLDRRAETFSGGEKRRLNLAIALLNAPRVLYLDEPTVGIDARSRQTIIAAIAELKAQGVTVIYTSHYMEEVEALCDHLAVIDRGRVLALGAMEAVLARYALGTLEVRLLSPLADTGRTLLSENGAIWTDDLTLALPASAGDGPAEVFALLARAGARVGQAAWGVARLEKAYLDILESGAAA